MGRRRRSSPGFGPALWADMMLAGAATVATFSVRLPRIATGTMSRAESTRMVAEKAAAAIDGAAAGMAAATRVAARRMGDPKAVTPAAAMADLVAVAEAASRPARRTVKANAERLGRSRLRRYRSGP